MKQFLHKTLLGMCLLGLLAVIPASPGNGNPYLSFSPSHYDTDEYDRPRSQALNYELTELLHV